MCSKPVRRAIRGRALWRGCRREQGRFRHSHDRPGLPFPLFDAPRGRVRQQQQRLFPSQGGAGGAPLPPVCLSPARSESRTPPFLPSARQVSELRGVGYAWLRRTRGDGNCFFRAFLYGYLEALLLVRAGGRGSIRGDHPPSSPSLISAPKNPSPALMFGSSYFLSRQKVPMRPGASRSASPPPSCRGCRKPASRRAPCWRACPLAAAFGAADPRPDIWASLVFARSGPRV